MGVTWREDSPPLYRPRHAREQSPLETAWLVGGLLFLVGWAGLALVGLLTLVGAW